MSDEKLPKEYDQSVIQKVVEGLKKAINASSQKASRELYDTAQEIKDSIKKLSKKVSALAGEPEEQQQSIYIPPPEDLKVYEFGSWGFATVNPFLRWKYRGTIVGYEFYGTMNVDENKDFEPQESEYVQQGIHFAYTTFTENGTESKPNTYLNTLDPSGNNTHILDLRLLKPLAANRLILENLTTGEWGYIGGDGRTISTPIDPFAYGVPSAYRIRAGRNTSDDDGGAFNPTAPQTYVKWRGNDRWRIRDYPSQSLFTIGPFAIFYKRPGNIYVKARTIGKGHSYSTYTEAVCSTGTSSTSDDLPAPKIVMPKHQCNPAFPNIIRECTLESANNFKPYCTGCKRVVKWDEIVSGTRQIDHFAIFGFEWASVEFVYEELDSSYGNFIYQTRHGIYGTDEEFKAGEDVEGADE